MYAYVRVHAHALYVHIIVQLYVYVILGTSSPQPQLCQLLEALKPLAADWYTLGIQLGYDADTLNAIRKNNSCQVESCICDLLSKWQQKYPDKGWCDIVSALRKMDRNDVAIKVERQYISPSPSMLLPTVLCCMLMLTIMGVDFMFSTSLMHVCFRVREASGNMCYFCSKPVLFLSCIRTCNYVYVCKVVLIYVNLNT